MFVIATNRQQFPVSIFTHIHSVSVVGVLFSLFLNLLQFVWFLNALSHGSRSSGSLFYFFRFLLLGFLFRLGGTGGSAAGFIAGRFFRLFGILVGLVLGVVLVGEQLLDVTLEQRQQQWSSQAGRYQIEQRRLGVLEHVHHEDGGQQSKEVRREGRVEVEIALAF